ncbi:MAG: DUF371 domain-containing protein [Nitrosopumilaceae archaeon]|nr:DUF371 domain-containing protein [Nitrosopumilaceae archaeon]NIU02111.1 DUF371 domain-containing protein [Nitrosopumilaceae archaeon]NIU88503.1 DUF371 domain-containing protein [Nitrosopumilaceae archaeon]NIV66745.1 DUF371 domain-containing protein [Nitrosopumilaceae archaeon]NIX62712.1 DUF371 domain-containing protein [Nitrosopumilaceae archaeon]
MQFEIEFSGHKNITSLHQKTIEITKDCSLTPKGDCIIGVNASAGCKDIPDKIKSMLKDPTSIATITIMVGSKSFEIQGYGHPELSLANSEDIVIRKSDFTCPRTLAVRCNHASDSIPRDLISDLKKPRAKGKFIIDVLVPN